MDTSRVTRFEVIGKDGRMFTTYGRVDLALQDDGQTLKVFLTELSDEEADRVRREHLAGLAALLDPGSLAGALLDSKPMVWRCEQCPREFTSHANLARHDQAHRGQLPL